MTKSINMHLITDELVDAIKEFFGADIEKYSFTDTYLGQAPNKDGKIAYKIAYHIDLNDTMAGLQRHFPLTTLVNELPKLATLNEIQIYHVGQDSLLTVTETGENEFHFQVIPHAKSIDQLVPVVHVSVGGESPIESTGDLVEFTANLQSGSEFDAFAEKKLGELRNTADELRDVAKGIPNTAMAAEMPSTLPPQITHGMTEGVHPPVYGKNGSGFTVEVTEKENNFTTEQLVSTDTDATGNVITNAIIEEGAKNIGLAVASAAGITDNVKVSTSVADNVVVVDVTGNTEGAVHPVEVTSSKVIEHVELKHEVKE